MNKQIWVITGSLGGLGKAMTAECALRGYDLIITDLNQQKLNAFAKSLSYTYNINVLPVAADLTDIAERKNFWIKVNEKTDGITGIINIAGIDFEGAFIEKTSLQISSIIRVNIEAVLDMTKEALLCRDTSKKLTIINVSSLAAYQPMPLKAMYAASKRFLLDFSLALKQEIRDLNASITILCPAGMPTNDECIECIKSQGVVGLLTTIDVGRVAYLTLNAALKGKTIVCPGFINRFACFLIHLLPPSVTAKIVYKRWMTTRARVEKNAKKLNEALIKKSAKAELSES